MPSPGTFDLSKEVGDKDKSSLPSMPQRPGFRKAIRKVLRLNTRFWSERRLGPTSNNGATNFGCAGGGVPPVQTDVLKSNGARHTRTPQDAWDKPAALAFERQNRWKSATMMAWDHRGCNTIASSRVYVWMSLHV